MVGWPILIRPENELIRGGPIPGAGRVRLEFHPLNRGFMQILQTGGGLTEPNNQRGGLQFLLEFRYRDGLDFGGNPMRLRKMAVPVPCPRAGAADQEHADYGETDQPGMPPLNTAPAFSRGTEPKGRSPAYAAQEIAGQSGQQGTQRESFQPQEVEDGGCIHRLNTSTPLDSFRILSDQPPRQCGGRVAGEAVSASPAVVLGFGPGKLPTR